MLISSFNLPRFLNSSASFAWGQGTGEGLAMLDATPNLLGIEVKNVSAVGGNATLDYDYRIASSGTNKANMTFSLQKTLNL